VEGIRSGGDKEWRSGGVKWRGEGIKGVIHLLAPFASPALFASLALFTRSQISSGLGH
jgi:hypothetical protein